MADDDDDDIFLAQTAFEESDVDCELQFAKDGSEVLDLLRKAEKGEDEAARMPNLILLDLNMPRKNGWQVLHELKSSERLRHIPVLIFTTSKSPEHVLMSYNLGASSFITKPSSFNSLLDVVRLIGMYWKDVVTLT